MRELIERLDEASGDRKRAGGIVKLAASGAKDKMLKKWMEQDPGAYWEDMAIEYLVKSTGRAKDLGLSGDEVDEQIADMLLYFGLTARMKGLKK